jgi:hypothetical protein
MEEILKVFNIMKYNELYWKDQVKKSEEQLKEVQKRLAELKSTNTNPTK